MRNRIFLALDLVLAAIIVTIAFGAGSDGMTHEASVTRVALTFATFAIPIKIAGFWRVGLYSRLWRYASIADLEVAVVACALGIVISLGVGLGLLPALHAGLPRIPMAVLILDGLLTSAAVTMVRLVPRMSRHMRGAKQQARKNTTSKDVGLAGRRVLIAGAGDAGGMIAKELRDNRQLGLVPVGFVDDDATKHGHYLQGIPVLGPIAKLEEIVRRHRVEEVITALPSAGGRIIRDIMQRATAAGARNRTVPGLYELLSGAKAVSALRPIEIHDLLRREPIKTNPAQVASLVTGRTVLVTGAGGSIGSELCRQLAQLKPTEIVAVGRGENSIFELLEELRRTFPQLRVSPAIVDVRDSVRMRAVFETYCPYSVFHAAAHKHVPLMESNVDEAVLNNVLGTRTVAELAAEFDVEHFVLISSDKAVRPTSIMGATKRIAEAVICSIAERTGKPYVTVRFGNVLGSRGSVVPTFMRQIAAGGPITITHPEMRRYFMTIPEAVQLVLQAAALGRGGEVFVLDMGDPVRIADLAEDLIRLSGLQVGSDIEICYTGMRPGEKLYEELFFGQDDAAPTSHEKILRARDGDSSEGMRDHIDLLIESARRRLPEADLRRTIHDLVPEYQPPAVRTDVPVSIAPVHIDNGGGESQKHRRQRPAPVERSIHLEAS